MGLGAWYTIYKKGVGTYSIPPTLRQQMERGAVNSIRDELIYRGYEGLKSFDAPWGSTMNSVVKQFQTDHGLTVDGQVGRKTATALFAVRVRLVAAQAGIPDDLLAKLWDLESGFDPGAQGYVDDNDHGPAQINLVFHPDITLFQAESGSYAAPWSAKYLTDSYAMYHDWDAAVASYNVGRAGARDWLAAGKPDNTTASRYVALVRGRVVAVSAVPSGPLELSPDFREKVRKFGLDVKDVFAEGKDG